MGERKTMSEQNINWLPLAYGLPVIKLVIQACALSEFNWKPFGTWDIAKLLEPHGPGPEIIFFFFFTNMYERTIKICSHLI